MIGVQCHWWFVEDLFIYQKAPFENFCNLWFCHKSRYCEFFDGPLLVSWLGREVKNDMSDQYNVSLRVCNVKIRKFLRGRNGLIFDILRVASSSVEGFKFFFMASMQMLNLAVVNTFWPITSRSRLVHGCIHGPCLSPWIWANTAWSLLALLVDDLSHKL